MSLTKLTIPRKLWGRHALLNLDGTMCCLGHASVACGVPKEKLRNEGSPLGMPLLVWTHDYNVPAWITHEDNGARRCAAGINDRADEESSDADREAELITLFKNKGIELVFTGEEP